MTNRLSRPAEGGPDAEGGHGDALSLLHGTARVAVLAAALLAAARADAAPAPIRKPVPEAPATAPQPPAAAAPAGEPPPFLATDLAVAGVLINDDPEAPVPDSLSPGVMQALWALAVKQEILDPREVRYTLSPEDLACDLKMLRRRNRDLKDAPPLADSERFAPRTVVSEMLAFNRAYRQNLELRLSVERVREQELQDAIHEADLLYRLWDGVRDSRCEHYYVTVRRQALKRVLETIGPQNYYGGGSLPPHVPLWRFQTID